ncbi:MAG: hypothetical protein NTY12_01300 [Candidatus Falkowbacteria bacterium]|nr:hypothetical protein [Candidatus Falkowbacteria bacterium]
MRKSSLKRIVNALVITSLVMVMANFGYYAQAANLTTLSDNLTRLKTSTLADHTIQFVTPTGVAAGQTITLTFSSGFTMGTFAVNNVDVATAATCAGSFTDKTLAASPATTTWGVAQVGQVITITSATDTIAATNCVRIKIGSNASIGGAGATQITNPATAQTATLAVAAGNGVDSGTAGIAIVDTNFDQVSVTATVDPTLTFALSDSSIGFGTLSSTNAHYATGDTLGTTTPTVGNNVQVSTNATSGYTVYVQGATLTSGGNTITAMPASAASSTNSEQFGLNVAAAGGTGTASAPYATSSQYAYTATATTQTPIGSATGPSATTTFSLTYLANIAATTEAGSYTTTLTYTATGSF